MHSFGLEDLAELIKVLKLRKKTTFVPKYNPGMSGMNSFRLEPVRKEEFNLFLSEQGGVLKGGRMELSMLTAETMPALISNLEKTLKTLRIEE